MRTYQTDPRGQAPLVTWRQWLLPLGAAAGIVALVALSPRPVGRAAELLPVPERRRRRLGPVGDH
jgi:hypothetical protein